MTLNVSNHHGMLLADHFLFPQYIARVCEQQTAFDRPFTLIEHVSAIYHWGQDVFTSYQQAYVFDISIVIRLIDTDSLNKVIYTTHLHYIGCLHLIKMSFAFLDS